MVAMNNMKTMTTILILRKTKDNQLDDDGGDNDVDANDCELANMQWQSVSR